MPRTDFPGASYVDALPSGAWVMLYAGSHLQTHLGRVDLPPGEAAFGLLFLRCSEVGGFHFAGKGHDSALTWEWRDGRWTSFVSPTGRGCYDQSGRWQDTLPAGYQFCADDGSMVSRIDTYPPQDGLSEWTLRADVRIGQGHEGGGVRVFANGVLRELAPGYCVFINANRDGEQVAVSFWEAQADSAAVVQTTLAALRALPPVEAPEPTPEPPDPEPPEPPDPEPEPPDPEPVPDPPYPPIHEAIMENEQGWLIGPGDKAVSIDAAGHVTFTTTDLTDADLLQLTPQANDAHGRCALRPVAHATLALGADATQHTPTGNVCQQFYGKTATDPELGNYELWSLGQWPSGIVTAVIEYIDQGADHGRHWQAAGLTWVKKS